MCQSNRVIGVVTAISSIITDPNKIRTWQKKEIIVEINDDDKTILGCFNIWKVDFEKFNVEVNDKIEITFKIISKLRNNGKYYTDLNVLTIKRLSNRTPDFQNKTNPVVSPTPEEVEKSKEFEDDFHF